MGMKVTTEIGRLTRLIPRLKKRKSSLKGGIEMNEKTKMHPRNPKIRPPEGRQEITGEVITIHEHDGIYNGLNVILKCEGYRLWGNLPRKMKAKKGELITFTTTVSVWGVGYGFFYNPTGGRVL